MVYSILFFICYFFVISRGIFELLVDKEIAYLIQAIMWIIFIFSIHINTNFRYKNKNITVAMFFCFFCYLSSILISSMLTYYFKSFDYLWIYMLVSIYFTLLLISSSTINYNISNKINFSTSIFALTIYASFIGILEQLEVISPMPGSWNFAGLVRPASTFGSMQHYAITLAMLCFINFEIYMSNRKVRYMISGLLALVCSIISFTRSGSMIIIIGFSIYFIVIIFKSSFYMRISRINLVFLLFFTVIPISLLIYFYDSIIIDRIVSSININEAGNNFRIRAWNSGINLWKETNILFGTYTGYITNATNRLSIGSSHVVESSLIQQLLNFGLLGCISFYLLLLIQYFHINKNHILLKCCMLSSIVQTLVFQSIETVPFMATLTLIPVLSNNLYLENVE